MTDAGPSPAGEARETVEQEVLRATAVPQLEHRVLVGAPTPHLHSGADTKRIMLDVIIALLPAALLSVLFFGLPALLLIIVGIAAAELSEMGFKKMMARPFATDYSAAVTGLLVAMLVPANMPAYWVALAAVVAIGLGKMAYGGLGQNPFNPALIAYVFLKVSFPGRFAVSPPNLLGAQRAAAAAVDSITQATPLALYQGVRLGTNKIADIAALSRWQMFWGVKAGALGEVSAAALILGGLYLLARRVITWHAPVGYLATVSVLTGLLWALDPKTYIDPVFHLLAGGLMLGAFFMATDPSSTPITRRGRLAFGIGCGLMTSVIRTFGGFAEGVAFSILLMNALAPTIDTVLVPPALRKDKAANAKEKAGKKSQKAAKGHSEGEGAENAA